MFHTLCLMSVLSCIAHASHMHTISTLDAHLTHTLDHLTCFAFHSRYVSLVRPLALKTWSYDFVLLLLCIFRTFCFVFFFFTNLCLIKFVSMFVFVFVSLCWCLFCRCLLLRKRPQRSLQSVPTPPWIHFEMTMPTWHFLITSNGP